MTHANAAGQGVSGAWMSAVAVLTASTNHRLFHLVTRITPPFDEIPELRTTVDERLEQLGLQPIETVANTVFPADLARLSSSPRELAERYRAIYPRIRKFAKNSRGTYFGRLVEYPGRDGEQTIDQLNAVIDKLRRELSLQGPLSSSYEVSIQTGSDLLVPTAHADTYLPPEDRHVRMGFPCLSSCGFHLDSANGTLNLVALYRNEYLIERGYGNYLGLTRLLAYVASECGLQPAELMEVAGHAELDHGSTLWARQLLASQRTDAAEGA